ncbi:MAG: hypothetical protein H6585_06550 [Flavobacteriales bacterium]|nr:hypothetical protein [Flavobacteriales bacterium]MCB9447989.1 hypothetical protein [Flavobacteriales bacterium]
MNLRITFFTAFMAAGLLSACVKEAPTTTELLQDDARRNEVMDAICNDPKMLGDMMQHVHQNQHAMDMMQSDSTMMNNMMQMMHGNPGMMQHMMSNMMNMAAADSSTCKQFCKMMEGNEHMRCAMHDMMKDSTMMNKDMPMHRHGNMPMMK